MGESGGELSGELGIEDRSEISSESMVVVGTQVAAPRNGGTSCNFSSLQWSSCCCLEAQSPEDSNLSEVHDVSVALPAQEL